MILAHPFIFVRHGETEGNVRFICQGSTDYPLTERGRQQADQAGKVLATLKKPLKIFSSDLGRAYTSAEIIVQHLGNVPIQVEPGLRERCYGALEGGSSQHVMDLEAREIADPDYTDPSIAGLESQIQLRKRIADTLNRIFQEQEGMPVLVSHGRLFFVLSRMLGIPPEQQLGNGIPLLCEPDGRNWRVTVLG